MTITLKSLFNTYAFSQDEITRNTFTLLPTTTENLGEHISNSSFHTLGLRQQSSVIPERSGTDKVGPVVALLPGERIPGSSTRKENPGGPLNSP